MLKIKNSAMFTLFGAMLFSTHLQSAPIQTVDLHGSFYEMGKQYADTLGDTLILQKELSKTLYPTDPLKKEMFEKLINSYIQVAKTRYPQELNQFFQGEVDSDFAKTHHFNLDDFVFLDNVTFFIKVAIEFDQSMSQISSEFCSFLGLIKPDHSVLIGRNFDFPRKFMQVYTTYPLVIRMQHSDKQLYPNQIAAVSYVGNITTATVFNDKGHYISINAGVNAQTDAKFVVLQRPSYMGNMLITMMKNTNFSDIENWTLQTAPDYPYIVNIAGPDKDNLLSIESSAFNELQGHYQPHEIPQDVFLSRARKAMSEDTIHPELDTNQDFLVATNTFHLLNWEPVLGHDIWTKTPGFSTERYQNLIDLARTNASDSIEGMQSIFEKELNTNHSKPGATVNYCGIDPYYATDPSTTYYSIVFDTESKKFAVRFQQKEDSATCISHWTEWQAFSF